MKGRIEKIIGNKNYGIIYTSSWQKYYFHEKFCITNFAEFKEGNEVLFSASCDSLGAVAVDVKLLAKGRKGK